ncbi:electron transfer flavoprotein subunit alpha/FixB family protein [Fervidobacterium thailandense]|uniref:Electron transfer flavoprotein subunit alpha n=1 Tax=Fervidobacterium thailandense TaxID=1008305 RepID=A0A1E3G2S3_9BACT|nr:electron transfer flavoprotein subunit alpha/FixB family protein [Fervidobacterium thailandense]ODN29958.1 electron transfer flavoprotein subunit alpha [Fervidobacterium thailandense]
MVMVFCQQANGELHKVGLELVGKASELGRDLNAPVTAVILGNDIRHLAPILIQHGADRVIIVEHPLLEAYNVDLHTKALFEVIEHERPEILLLGATQLGRELAPRLAARLKTGLTADCTNLEIDPETKLLLMTRPAFSGNLMATIVCPSHRPQMATVRPGVFPIPTPNPQRHGEIVEFKVRISLEDTLLKLEDVILKVKRDADISNAKIIVAGGRGIGSKDGFETLKELAELLGGTVAGSRAAVENGWIERDRQVGQTGKTVRPKLYIAVGISGAIQHLAGMQDSEFIVAINKDPDAPIMKIADLGIVGDWKQVVPRLIKSLRKLTDRQLTEESVSLIS